MTQSWSRRTCTTSLASEPTSGIAGWATSLVDTMGGPGAGLAIALENLFPPLPSEVILPLTGFAAGQGVISLFSALFWTTLGSVVGAVALYWIGALFGRERMYALWERLPLVKVSDLEKTERWFLKHGRKAIFFGRMIPIFRSLISVPAGVERMPLPIFVLFTSLGSFVWNFVLVMAGYLLGDQWDLVERYVRGALQGGARAGRRGARRVGRPQGACPTGRAPDEPRVSVLPT